LAKVNKQPKNKTLQNSVQCELHCLEQTDKMRLISAFCNCSMNMRLNY